MENIKAVIFDLDNTLANRKKSFLNYCADFLNLNLQKFNSPDSFDDMIAYMVLLDKNGFCNKMEFYSAIIEKWKIRDCTPQQLIEKHAEVFGKYAVLDVDALMVLDYLAPKYKRGIITNGSSKTQNEKIDNVFIRNKFDSVIVSGDVGVVKPDKRIFELSCKELEVLPCEAVYIGDSYDLDIAGAKNAGLYAIWYTDSDETTKHDIIIRSLLEITEIL